MHIEVGIYTTQTTMQIQLKQVEIVAGIKHYLAMRGLNLAGQEVTVSFTAGRKEGGLIADVSIEGSEVDLPLPAIQVPVRPIMTNSVLRSVPTDMGIASQGRAFPLIANDVSEFGVAGAVEVMNLVQSAPVAEAEPEKVDAAPVSEAGMEPEPEPEAVAPAPVTTPVKSLFS